MVKILFSPFPVLPVEIRALSPRGMSLGSEAGPSLRSRLRKARRPGTRPGAPRPGVLAGEAGFRERPAARVYSVPSPSLRRLQLRWLPSGRLWDAPCVENVLPVEDLVETAQLFPARTS